uniref:ATP synthase F0 subunit 8 n=1 Tax=Longzhouacris mirabilis TaxID=3016385 RepID=UPI00233E9861|nr:ATP synthase F0 subunit 8 [Longzhouacris mirabilis]WAX39732.1 ATP synthase F0 subunit 8 [Longzhouacris mirabilis]
MPQMSPLMWFYLFIMFSITMILFNQMNFFSFKSNPIKEYSKKMNPKSLNWKW